MAKFAHDSVMPDAHSSLEKKDQVARMFDDISFRYDFLNRFLSLGIDQAWRRKALQTLKNFHPASLLDVATGTGDIAIMAAKILKPKKIVGIDISNGMINIGKNKVAKKNLGSVIELQQGDSSNIKFSDDSFDAATVAFGVRNFQHLELGLKEIYRVLKPGGKIVILEFSKPQTPIIKQLYNFYMFRVSPFIGKLFSKNIDAYKYLDASIKKFPEGNYFLQIMNEAGFKNSSAKKLTFGICSLYTAEK